MNTSMKAQKSREAARKYRQANLEKCRAAGRKCQREINNQKRFGGLRYIALERDKYTCQKCFVQKKRLSVHHLNNDKTDHRLENLSTLCQKCHASWHYQAGDGLVKNIGKPNRDPLTGKYTSL